MPRRLLFLLLLLALVLAACKPANQKGTATVEAGKTPIATAVQTASSNQPGALDLPEKPSVPGCTVVSFLPTPDPSSVFPPITENDWYRGPLDATVKIIEYSDFQ